MKKNAFLVLFSIISNVISAQSNTEIYLADLNNLNDKIELKNLRNISINKGYDNQPSFYDDATIVFASTRNKQTDIKMYSMPEQKSTWICDTGFGSEYSPLKISKEKNISAVRLDSTGLQRLYVYDIKNGKSKELLKDLKVGYHVWHDKNTLLTTVLVENRMDLLLANLKTKTNSVIYKNVGRSLHKIPNSSLLSFISNQPDATTLMSVSPTSGEIKTIIQLPNQAKDMCWLNETTVLIPNGKTIAQINITDGKQSVFYTFVEEEIYDISRMVVSKDGKHLAFVSEESPSTIVQNQVDSFNLRDLNAFASCFSEKVVVSNFQSDTLSVGNAKMKSGYEQFFANNPECSVKVLKRIAKGKVVIDHELVNIKGKEMQQVAIYEVNNGKISSMTFIQEKSGFKDIVNIIEEELNAYNARDIDNFVKTFSSDIKVYDFPNKLTLQGLDKLHDTFSNYFSRTPNLHCDINSRIILGNIVIDEELITANERKFSAVVIYEIINDKIVNMTVVR